MDETKIKSEELKYKCDNCDCRTNVIYKNLDYKMWLCEKCHEDAGGFENQNR